MKILKTLLLTATLLLFSACGNKTAFKLQEPLDSAALVYVYAKVHLGSSDSVNRGEYSLRINNKPVMQRIKDGEYMVLNLKPQAMTLSATKNQIQEVVLDLDLKEGETYYLKIVDSQDGSAFDFVKVKSSEAKAEIASTGLAGSSEESPENIITEFVNPKKSESMEVKAVAPAPVSAQAPATSKTHMQTAPMSKTDEIMKAYGLKEKGIINEEEFKTLKTNILNK
ncbi:hypothetical protein M947_06115 [Sulfurimonas hongkongensis]|uniref:DUF2846 domain-containing protein n=1 Tax=Sulfurimonas hongkongensis TaxID=1172190 RepID=T0KRA6_9BACT|nr:hypothetical protein [Sulfurimonas hongkongensis]EQB39564.1 hypothetical protein M947_06115 [Sulfurimonas hongkongensis]